MHSVISFDMKDTSIPYKVTTLAIQIYSRPWRLIGNVVNSYRRCMMDRRKGLHFPLAKTVSEWGVDLQHETSLESKGELLRKWE